MSDAVATKRTALVTGAVTGLGASFAELLARRGFNLVLVDKQEQRLAGRVADLAARHGVDVYPIAQDLRDPSAGARIEECCATAGRRIDLLVNNAGFSLNTLFRETEWREVDGNVRVLLNVVVELTHRFLPGMLERRWGRIVNVASMSGFMPGGVRLATYNASKTFLIPFTEALDFELRGTGVRATAVCPGFTKTEFYVASDTHDVRDSVPAFMWLEPDKVAGDGIAAAMRGKPIQITGLPNQAIATAAKFVPRKLLRDRTRVLHRKAHDEMAAIGPGTSAGGPRRAAVVTGASSGIGASFAELLAREGFDLVLVARREEVLKERADGLARRHGIRAHAFRLDLAEQSACEALLAECDRLSWPVEVLVNSAGYPANQLFARMAWTDVAAVLQVLFNSIVHLTHAFVRRMIARGSGRIINVASLAAFEPGSYRSTLYSSAKAAVVAFSESVDSELEGTGVHVSALCPGFTRTEWASKSGVDESSVPRALWMDSDAVAALGLAGARRGDPVVVAGTPAQRLVTKVLQ
jgi:short-subunit dehydrogenase